MYRDIINGMKITQVVDPVVILKIHFTLLNLVYLRFISLTH